MIQSLNEVLKRPEAASNMSKALSIILSNDRSVPIHTCDILVSSMKKNAANISVSSTVRLVALAR